MIALWQLNRGPEQRADKKPAISDLRASGSLEQDADMVILLHRESAYERDNPRQGEADFIVAKRRNGPTDTITVAFHDMFSRFVDMPSSLSCLIVASQKKRRFPRIGVVTNNAESLTT
ncbi:replicative DNA helicase [Frigoribacterium sp. 2355]